MVNSDKQERSRIVQYNISIYLVRQLRQCTGPFLFHFVYCKIVQITLFMTETIVFGLGDDDLVLKLETFLLLHTQLLMQQKYLILIFQKTNKLTN